MRTWAASALIGALAAAPAQAQEPWRLTAEAGMTSFSEAFHDSSTPPIAIGAWRPTMYTLRLTGHLGKLGVGFGASLAKSGMGGGDGTGVVVVFEDQLVLLELAPEIRVPVIADRHGTRLIVHAGPVWDHWSLSGEQGRSRRGGLGGFTLSFPVGASWRTDLRGDIALTGSFVEPAEAVGGVQRPSHMRRSRLALGITRTL